VQNPPFFWLRLPLLSIEQILSLLAKNSLTELLADKMVMEAIQIASPSIADQLVSGKETNAKVADTFLKYALRMSTRCTPFGLFAGGTVGYPAKRSVLDFTERCLVTRHRLSMPILVSLINQLSQEPGIRNRTRYFANQSVFQVGELLHYTEKQWKDSQWNYFTSQVPASPAIVTVLSLARRGATLAELLQALTPDKKSGEVLDFIEQLIDDNLLWSELMPTPSGPDPLTELCRKLTELSAPPSIVSPLSQIQHQLETPERTCRTELEIRKILTDFMGVAPSPEPVLQTDTRIAGGQNFLSHSVLKQVQHDLSPLLTLSQFTTEPVTLTTFKKRFHTRYQEQEIPLLVALDEQLGVGYTSTTGLNNATQDNIFDLLVELPTETVETCKLDKLHELKLKLYSTWSRQSSDPVIITDEALTQLGDRVSADMNNCYAFGYLLANSVTALDAGQYRFMLKALSGPSAYSLMGRFCTIDRELERLVSAQLVQQQADQPDRIYAEIVHLPQPRAGNVLQRPHLRDYEIPYLTPSALPLDQQIPLEDLLVSVPDGKRVVLRSKRLNKEIIPQLTTAHNYRNGLPLYQFLGDLQYQTNSVAVSWHWGALTQARRLPRVQYRNIILQEATWTLNSRDLRSELTDEENLTRLQREEQLPRLIALVEADQELFLDLASSLCRKLFITTLRRLTIVRLIEWLRTPENCMVSSTTGKLTHEIVIPFISQPEQTVSQPSFFDSADTKNRTVKRTFSPGSEWLYIKIYCGPLAAPLILNELIRLAQHSVDTGQVKQWFFLRYADPEHHLRFRFRLIHPDQTGSLLAACHQRVSPLLVSGVCYKLQVDTYERELERFGEGFIEEMELLFWRNSEVVSQLLYLDLDESNLLAAACLGVDTYYREFGLTDQEKSQFIKQAYTALFEEHGASPGLRQKLSKKYRLNQDLIEQLLESPVSITPIPLYQIIDRLRFNIRPQIASIKQKLTTNDPTRQRQLITSLGHLFINRLFAANQRTYELLVYHHLYRGYESVAARTK
jgi:thiopeptide-type bacteriocin biosynthesis protein